MRLFGLEITRSSRVKALSSVSMSGRGGWWPLIREPYAGAWQRNDEMLADSDLVGFGPIYAAITTIAQDIGKMEARVVRRMEDGRWKPTLSFTPWSRPLQNPNHYQTNIDFFEQWILSKLMHGNTLVFIERDADGKPAKFYIIDWTKVTALVSTSGDVFYQIQRDDLAGVAEPITVPLSEVIHDRMPALFHPLIGTSPLIACALSGTMGSRIQRQSLAFFQNMSRPSGMLTAPGEISDETATRLKEYWESNFSGGRLGGVAVAGDGLKYDQFTMPATDAQLIEQLRFSVEDVARAFKIPLYKLNAGATPPDKGGVLEQNYYSMCLQSLIEKIERLMPLGLEMPWGVGVEFDTDALIRMDPLARSERLEKGIKGGWLKPNEARYDEGYDPVEGGDTPYLQQQNYSLAALAKRDAKDDPFGKEVPAPAEVKSAPVGTESLRTLLRARALARPRELGL